MNKALLALAVGGFGIGMTEFVIMGILPDVADALQITIPQAGHFISAYALGVVIGAPILTGLGSRWPAHRMLFWLMIWFTVANTASAFATSYPVLLVARFLSGLPHGAFFGIGAVVAGRLSRPGREAQAIAIMFTGLTVANIIGVPLGTYFGHEFHWNVAFLMVGGVGVLAVLSIRRWMPRLPVSSAAGLLNDLKVFKRLELWMVILLTTVGTGGFFAWYSYIAPLVTEVAGHPEEVVSYAMILAGVGMAIGNILGAQLADRFPPMYAVVMALVLITLTLVINVFAAEHKVAVLVMTFVIGVVAFCLSAPLQMAMINTAKGSEMLGSSLNQSAFNVGNASGAYFAGLPIALGYGFTSADLVGAGMAMAGVIIAGAIILLRKRKIQEAVPVKS